MLRNLLGIIDPAVLQRADADFSALRLAQLRHRELAGNYDLDHLRGFHCVLFGDVYPWAGELRTVGIAKGDPFCLPQHIEAFAEGVFSRLATADYLRGRVRAEFIDGLTELLGDLNALHAFRDGNGRTQRAFCAQLARHAGHQLRWAAMDPVENIAASRASLRGDNTPLGALLQRLVDRPDPSSTAPHPRTPLDPHPGGRE
ncbi:MAG: Fic/DOC family protein [Pseudonocardiaceae bacterium]